MSSAEEPNSMVARLVERPDDPTTLAELHASLGESPERYASVLEAAARACVDTGAASHYLTEAGRTYLETVHDVPEGCRLLAQAVELDPLNARAADLLANAVASELRGADYGGLLRRRAAVLERLASHDVSLVVRAAEAWERYAENLVRTGGDSNDAVAAMRRAFDLMRGVVHDTTPPPPPPSGDRDTVQSRPNSEPRSMSPRDTIRTGKPHSAMLPAVGLDRDGSDSAPTRPRPSGVDASRESMFEEDFDLDRRTTLKSPPPDGQPPRMESPSEEPDRLIALFEALREVDRAPTVEQAGWLLVELARRTARARAAFLHVFDQTHDEYSLIAVSGACDRSVVGERSPCSDPVLERAARAERSITVQSGDPGLSEAARYQAAPPKRCALVAPSLQGDAVVGAIELLDPLDRGAFDPSDGYALTYVAERWGEVLAEHGRV